MTAANFHVASDAAIVILIVQVLIITSVLSTLTEIKTQPILTADVNISTEGEGSFLADAEAYYITRIHDISSDLQFLVQGGDITPVGALTLPYNVSIARVEVGTFLEREKPCGGTAVISIEATEALPALR